MTSADKAGNNGQAAMQTPPVVSPQDWEAARQQLLVKEKAHTRARDALAAESPLEIVDDPAELLRVLTV